MGPRLLILLAAITAAPAALQAQSAMGAPEGCKGTLTVQQRGCRILNVWTCEAEPGITYSSLGDEDGPFRIKKTDAEFQWLATYYPRAGDEQTLAPSNPDPESITELIDTGYDSFDFSVRTALDGIETRVVGHDRLTGETEIDGEPLLTTEYEMTYISADGGRSGPYLGQQYLSARHRLFILGESWDAAAPEDVTDNSPVEFIYPGEEGFFSDTPRYGCDMLMSSFQP
ncbi:hypothetical protein [Pelagovum pacificum]|uniref:Uncharacterized protein n=1 Tax=Pelagovum pacificum TaxID=2588711 RepID=A0A5C5GHA1_9RHOB|nr:hypothetical protein [Pelagovum pacificum]QQA42884.1 hypothetical protein I8N54_19280 [Pelagovum pacificum]TNY33970.1 hypothetical protein FHY64_12105 [Pelagovum pacificum]